MNLLIIFHFCFLFGYTLTEYDHSYYWRDYRGKILHDAVDVGEGKYIGQVHTSSGLLPATFYSSKEEAYSACYGRRIIVKNAIKILCDQHSQRMYWKYVNIDKMKGDELDDLVIGGMEANITLFVGKIFHEGDWRIGKVYLSDHKLKGLIVWRDDGTDCNFHDFQILKINGNYTSTTAEDSRETWV